MSMINKEYGFDTDVFDSAKDILQTRHVEALTYYIEDTAMYLDDIEQRLQKKESAKIYASAHAIKSSGKQIGVVHASQIAEDIELSARAISQDGETDENTFDKIEKNKLPHLKDAYKKAVEALQDFIDSHPA